MSQSPVSIIEHLLDNNALPTEVNSDGDTVLHFAIKHWQCSDLPIFRRMLRHVKDIQLLAIQNDVGMSVLHAAVNERRTLFAKAIINHINDTLGLDSADRNMWETCHLGDIYRRRILSFTALPKPVIHKHDMHPAKMNLINQRERKSGRTSLFIATCLQNDMLIQMLLFHMADPRIADLSDLTCQQISTDVNQNPDINSLMYNSCYVHRYIIDPMMKGAELISSTVEPLQRGSVAKRKGDDDDDDDCVPENIKLKKVFFS